MKRILNIIVVTTDKSCQELFKKTFSQKNELLTIVESGRQALESVADKRCDVMILDYYLPDMSGLDLFKTMKKSQHFFEAIIIADSEQIDDATQWMEHGVYDCIAKPLNMMKLKLLIEKAYEKKKLAIENMSLKNQQGPCCNSSYVIGKSRKINELKKLIKQVSTSSLPILILGETGTGKKYVANCIHQSGKYNNEPFVYIDCATTPPEFIETKIFGSLEDEDIELENPAAGLLEKAEDGTLHLQNIEFIPPATQLLIHNYMETGLYHCRGLSTPIKANVRIIGSTRKNLRKEIQKKTFREDFYFKLGVITIHVPPLKERTEDILEIAKMFIERKNGNREGKTFSNKGINSILNHQWPGNTRELLNVMEQAYTTAKGKTIMASDITIGTTERKVKKGETRSLTEVEKEHILEVLSQADGNISLAAKTLGISRPKLYRKIEQYTTGSK